MIAHPHLIAASGTELKTGVVLALSIHHVELVIVVGTVNFFVISCCSENGSVELVTTLVAIFSVISAAISCVICVNVMRIIVV